MKTLKLSAQFAAITCTLGVALNVSATSINGPTDAVAVCQAIVADNAPEVSRLLSDYRESNDYSIAVMTSNRALLKDARNAYQCNGMALKEFAGAIGAEKTSALLGNPVTTVEDYVADTRDGAADSNI